MTVQRAAMLAFVVNLYFIYQLLRTLYDGDGRGLAASILGEVVYVALVCGLLLYLRWKWR